MHLHSEELVDIAEGARAESSAPHLAACAACRTQLAEMRAVMAVVADVDVPEPSPLFWDHVSARVSDAVAREPRRTSWLEALRTPRILVPALSLAAAMVLAVMLVNSRGVAPSIVPPGSAAGVADARHPSTGSGRPEHVEGQPRELLASPASVSDDASLGLVAALTDDMDEDGAAESGLAARGSAEHAVTHLNDEELRRLEQLLKDEMARSGA
jgi:hypothetical protein